MNHEKHNNFAEVAAAMRFSLMKLYDSCGVSLTV